MDFSIAVDSNLGTSPLLGFGCSLKIVDVSVKNFNENFMVFRGLDRELIEKLCETLLGSTKGNETVFEGFS